MHALHCSALRCVRVCVHVCVHVCLRICGGEGGWDRGQGWEGALTPCFVALKCYGDSVAQGELPDHTGTAS